MDHRDVVCDAPRRGLFVLAGLRAGRSSGCEHLPVIGLVVPSCCSSTSSPRWSGRSGSDADRRLARRLRRQPARGGLRSSPSTCSASTTAGPAASGVSSARVERLVYRVMRIDPEREMRWTEYARGVLLFSAVSVLALLYALQRLQGCLPLNPAGPCKASAPTSPSTPPSRSSPTRTGRATRPSRPCRTSRRWSAWRCRTSSRPPSAWRSPSRSIRGFVRSGSGTHRQLLGRPRARHALRAAAARARARASCWSRSGVVQTFDGPVHAQTSRAATQTIARGPRGEPDRDQAARHQRRRLLQRQLRASASRAARRSRTSLEHLGAPADPVLDAVPVRAHGRPPAPGHRDPRGDG